MRFRLLALVLVLFGSGCASRPPANLVPAEPSLRVVTYNINWGMAHPSLVIDFLREQTADIVFLQETHAAWEALLKAQLGASYPHTAFVSSGGAGGIAILAKQELHDVRALPAQAGWFPALRAEVDTPVGRVLVLNVHLRPPLSDRGSATPSALYESPRIHRAELAAFLPETEVDLPLIVAGDFNESGRSGAAGELRERGLINALAIYDARTRTWEWPVFSGVTLRRRYDHVLFNRWLHCTGARVADVRASDHFPVIAVFTRGSR